MSTRSLDRQRGFTLVEALVALTLLSLIMTALFGSYRFGAAAWKNQKDQAEDTVDAAHRYLARLFERAYPLLNPETQSREPSVLFEGTSQSVTFTALSPPYPAGAGLHRFRLRVEKSDGGNSLILAFAKQQSGSVHWSGAREIILLETPNQLAIEYLGHQEGATWQGRWQDSARMPALVRLVSSSKSARSAWVFALRASAPAQCVADRGQTICTEGATG